MPVSSEVVSCYKAVNQCCKGQMLPLNDQSSRKFTCEARASDDKASPRFPAQLNLAAQCHKEGASADELVHRTAASLAAYIGEEGSSQ